VVNRGEKEKKRKEGITMKKVLPILLVVAMALPALAEVDVTAAAGTNPGELIVTVTPSNGAAVRGVALVLNTDTGDAVIDGTDDVVVSGLNTNIDYFFTNGTAGVGETSAGEGHAIAKADAAGAIDDPSDNRLPASSFSLSSAYLDPDSTQLGQTSAMTFTVTYTGTAGCISVAPDGLRGAIVGDNLGTITYPSACTEVTFGPGECFNDNLGNYAEWTTFGSPACWCFERNCHGDADGGKQGSPLAGYAYVFTNDLNKLIAGYGVKEPPQGPGILTITDGICADFKRDQQGSPLAGYSRVFTNDLNELIAWYGVKEAPQGSGVPLCPLAGAGGEINFYMYP
jgi:hypothetical protein